MARIRFTHRDVPIEHQDNGVVGRFFQDRHR